MRPTREHLAEVAKLRGATYEVKIATWIVRQLEARYVTYLDWRVQRQLGGLAKRLWVYLEAESYKAIGDGRERTYIALGEKAYTALGVHHARERDKRAALTRAAKRILEVDDHYGAIVVESASNNYRLIAERLRDRQRRGAAREIRESLGLANGARGNRKAA